MCLSLAAVTLISGICSYVLVGLVKRFRTKLCLSLFNLLHFAHTHVVLLWVGLSVPPRWVAGTLTKREVEKEGGIVGSLLGAVTFIPSA